MRVASIHTYPVKGGHRLDHDDASVEPWGLAGDRRWMVVGPDLVAVTQRELPGLVALRPAGHPAGLTLRAAGRMDLVVAEPASGEPLTVQTFTHHAPVSGRAAGPAADAWLSALLDQPVRLVWLHDPTARQVDPQYGEPADRVSFADGYPLLLANTASLADLNTALARSADGGDQMPMTRFRPNLVIDGAEAWVEDNWLGGRLRVGGLTFRVVKPCARCAVTTIDQETGAKGPEPLRVLAAHRRIGKELLFGVNLIPDTTGPVRRGDSVEPVA